MGKILGSDFTRRLDTIGMNFDHKKLYSLDGVYSEFTYGSPGVSISMQYALTKVMVDFSPLTPEKLEKPILVVGGGNGYEIVVFKKYGFKNVTGLELYCPDIPLVKNNTVIGDAGHMPFKDKEFWLVFCCDMFEHIKPEMTDTILNECRRVSKRQDFIIATYNDPPYNTHINIHDAAWWYKKFDSLDFFIEHFEYNPIFRVVSGPFIASTRRLEHILVETGRSDIQE